ncbi:MAG TPA: LysR family transcriptional regulator [Roseateles sp.]
MQTIHFTLQELMCLDAVVSEGSFQAAATKLGRSHPAVHAAISSLERGTGVTLLDREGYRARLTPAGVAFHRQAADVLARAGALEALAQQLVRGDETELRVVVGDLTPTAPVLRHLKKFFAASAGTRLHLHFESLGGPAQRLLADEADLVVHHIDKSDTRFEWLDLQHVTLVPVAAPSYLPFEPTAQLRPEQMKTLVQVVIRDSATVPGPEYFLIAGAPSWTVADQQTKKELIVNGMGWGHMPLHLIGKELRAGRLISLEGRHFKRSRLDIVVARRRGKARGAVAEALWQSFAGLAA